MLKTVIALTFPASSPLVAHADIANVGGGAIATYRVWEPDGTGGMLAEAGLNNYPRWAEPVGGLVARAMQALWAANEDNQRAPCAEVERVEVETRLASSHLLFAWTLARRDGSWTMEVWSDTAAPAETRSVVLLPAATWRDLVLQGQCWATWGEPVARPWPAPLRIPVIKGDHLAYVRFADIPEPARTVFERRMAHSTVPLISGEGPCAYAWDWEDFLAGVR